MTFKSQNKKKKEIGEFPSNAEKWKSGNCHLNQFLYK